MKKFYQSIVIFDTEFTSWKGAYDAHWSHPGQHRELIQIAARRWDFNKSWEQGDTFYANVKPVLSPVLSPYIKNLTGITQPEVSKAQSAKAVLTKFAKFIGQSRCWSNGGDINILAETAGLQRFVLPFDPMQFDNFYPRIYQAIDKLVGPYDKKKYPSGNLYKLLKAKLSKGKTHNALHDVNSLCATIHRLQELGVNMTYLWKA